ncbi:corticoliberin-like [Pseudoliparis swirei]|uniref:corticoliberin-like n=1 Tax=Pseudoliparis swirei TaxID=2059687 RepID=UPI0024BE6E6F|nr:corticoliberin-like [Pseudoliparis swirei]
MKMKVWVVALLAVFLSRSADCGPAPPPRRPLLPLLLRLGEEFSLQVGGGSSSAAALGLLSSSSSSSLAVNRPQEEQEEAGEKGRRSEEPPISLDLTFHLLRGVLQMARADRLAQQADSNRRLMDAFGR